MDIEQQNILYNDVFTYLYQDQINEQNRITREITDITDRDNLLKNIVDEQERWIIDNCTPLFFIEKSSNILQEYVRNFNVEKIMIELVEYYKNNGLNMNNELNLNGTNGSHQLTSNSSSKSLKDLETNNSNSSSQLNSIYNDHKKNFILTQIKGNQSCCDCGAPNPTWVIFYIFISQFN